jgi:hypothetical protein
LLVTRFNLLTEARHHALALESKLHAINHGTFGPL